MSEAKKSIVLKDMGSLSFGGRVEVKKDLSNRDRMIFIFKNLE